MIKNQSQCPYCKDCVVAYDWDRDKIIFNPDLVKPVPCKHLAYIGVYCLRLGGLHAYRHTIWMHPEAGAGLEGYMREIGIGTAKPDSEFKIADAHHEHKHKEGTDSVMFCGIYSSKPEKFVRACAEAA